MRFIHGLRLTTFVVALELTAQFCFTAEAATAKVTRAVMAKNYTNGKASGVGTTL